MVQKQKKKFEAIRVTAETHQEAKFIADKSGKSISATVSEIIGAVFDICVTYADLNLTYEYDGDKVTIVVSGKNNLISGCQKMPDSVLKEEAKAPQLIKNVEDYKPKKVNEK